MTKLEVGVLSVTQSYLEPSVELSLTAAPGTAAGGAAAAGAVFLAEKKSLTSKNVT